MIFTLRDRQESVRGKLERVREKSEVKLLFPPGPSLPGHVRLPVCLISKNICY